MYYKQWLALDVFDRKYLERYGKLPFDEKDQDLVDQRMDEIWKEMRMTEEEKELKVLQEQCPWN